MNVCTFLCSIFFLQFVPLKQRKCLLRSLLLMPIFRLFSFNSTPLMTWLMICPAFSCLNVFISLNAILQCVIIPLRSINFIICILMKDNSPSHPLYKTTAAAEKKKKEKSQMQRLREIRVLLDLHGKTWQNRLRISIYKSRTGPKHLYTFTYNTEFSYVSMLFNPLNNNSSQINIYHSRLFNYFITVVYQGIFLSVG